MGPSLKDSKCFILVISSFFLRHFKRRLQLVVLRRVPKVLKELYYAASGGYFVFHKTLQKILGQFCWVYNKETSKTVVENNVTTGKVIEKENFIYLVFQIKL